MCRGVYPFCNSNTPRHLLYILLYALREDVHKNQVPRPRLSLRRICCGACRCFHSCIFISIFSMFRADISTPAFSTPAFSAPLCCVEQSPRRALLTVIYLKRCLKSDLDEFGRTALQVNTPQLTESDLICRHMLSRRWP